MKISRRLKNYISLLFNAASAIGGTITTITLAITQGPIIYKKTLEIVTPALEYLFPSMPLKYQVLNLLTWLLVALFYISTWLFIFYAFRTISKSILNKYTHHILLDLEERAIEICTAAFEEVSLEHLDRLENKIDILHETVTPLTTQSAITGSTCSIPGVYRIQEKIFNGLEKTFAKDDIFLPAMDPESRKEVKVTWVYQNPILSEDRKDEQRQSNKSSPRQAQPYNEKLIISILTLLNKRRHLGLTTIRNTELPPHFTVEEMHEHIHHCLEQGYIEGPLPASHSDSALLRITEEGLFQLALMTTTLKDTRSKTF